MEQNKDKLHYIMSTNTIAWLKANGINEEYIEITENNKLKYYFKNNDELFGMIRQFKENAELQRFINQQNRVKSKIYEIRDK